MDFRTKFRDTMNEAKTDHYDDFAKLGKIKEHSRVTAFGGEASGKSVYKKINDEVKQLKERLKAAGLGGTVAGINADDPNDEYE